MARAAQLVAFVVALVFVLSAAGYGIVRTIQADDRHDGIEQSDLPPEFRDFPPDKQTDVLMDQTERERAEAAPHAPKETGPSPVLSCPVDTTSIKAEITPFAFGPFSGGRNLVNQAYVVSDNGTPYRLYAGASESDPSQGVIIVLPDDLDPCATAAGLLPRRELQTFMLPFKTGAAVLTALKGNLATFETADGTKAQFNYTTGEFLFR